MATSKGQSNIVAIVRTRDIAFRLFANTHIRSSSSSSSRFYPSSLLFTFSSVSSVALIPPQNMYPPLFSKVDGSAGVRAHLITPSPALRPAANTVGMDLLPTNPRRQQQMTPTPTTPQPRCPPQPPTSIAELQSAAS